MRNTLIFEMSFSVPYIENFHGPVDKAEEYFLHGINGRQMWNNGFNNIFCSSNVFIFHSSSRAGQFYAALPSARLACKSMSIKATECSYVTGSFHINSAATKISAFSTARKTLQLQCMSRACSPGLLQADAHYDNTFTSSDFTLYW